MGICCFSLCVYPSGKEHMITSDGFFELTDLPKSVHVTSPVCLT